MSEKSEKRRGILGNIARSFSDFAAKIDQKEPMIIFEMGSRRKTVKKTTMKKFFPLLFFIAFLFTDILSYIAFFSNYKNLITVVIAILFFFLSYKNITAGMLILLAELFFGGKGYLFSFDTENFRISIRIIFFIIISTFGFWKIFKEKKFDMFKPKENKMLIFSFGLFLFFIILGVLRGLTMYPSKAVYPDANQWAFFILFPVYYTLASPETFRAYFHQILNVSVITTGIKTFFTFMLFHHGFAQVNDPRYYRWIRDTGVGEVTPIFENIYRVFFQSHIFTFIALIFIVYHLWTKKYCKFSEAILSAITLYFSFFSIILGQSRSMWVGLALTLAVLFIVLAAKKLLRWKAFFISMILLPVILFSQISLMRLITGNYPIEPKRLEISAQDPSGATRINELEPLFKNIKIHPIFGWGFGKSLTYKSEDPRVSSYQTASAFEWGYLGLVLKIGILGTLSYLLFIILILKKTFETKDSLVYGIGIIFLAIVHIFTPYLDHPLGMGYLISAGVLLKKIS